MVGLVAEPHRQASRDFAMREGRCFEGAQIAHDYGVPRSVEKRHWNEHLPSPYAERAALHREMRTYAHAMRLRSPQIDWERVGELRSGCCVNDSETLALVRSEIDVNPVRRAVLGYRLRCLIEAHPCPILKSSARRNQRLHLVLELFERIREAGFIGSTVRNQVLGSKGLRSRVSVRTIDRDLVLLQRLGAIEAYRLKVQTEAKVARKMIAVNGSAPSVRQDCNLYTLAPVINLPLGDGEVEEALRLVENDEIKRYAKGRGFDAIEYLERCRSKEVEYRILPTNKQVLLEEQRRRSRAESALEGLHPWFSTQEGMLNFENPSELSSFAFSCDDNLSAHENQRKKNKIKRTLNECELANASEKISQGHEFDSHLLDSLPGRFGFIDFRPGQREIIEGAISKDTLLVSPTGSGKSFVFQALGAICRGLTVVVSPLLELMRDQVETLKKVGYRAAHLGSDQAPEFQRKVLADLSSMDFLYVSPEMFRTRRFSLAVREIPLGLLVVDEAHCFFEWGEDFRPSYQDIGAVAKRLNFARAFACSATIRKADRVALCEGLGLDALATIRVLGSKRETDTRVVRCSSASNKKKVLFRELDEERLARRKSIVFVGTRRDAECLAVELLSRGHACKAYHAGLDSPTRRLRANEFRSGSLEVLVCTSAYGMGIDQPDVAFVAHYSPPVSLETLLQQVGRGGRGSTQCRSLCVWTQADRVRTNYLVRRSPAKVIDRWRCVEAWLDADRCHRNQYVDRYFG